jgi:hypothetical protein
MMLDRLLGHGGGDVEDRTSHTRYGASLGDVSATQADLAVGLEF